MTDAAAFEAKIRENPADRAPYLVYADWLEDRDPEAATRQRQLAILRDRIAAYVADLNQRFGAAYGRAFESKCISAKWCRVTGEYSRQHTAHRFVYCFVALADYETKGLGKVRAGDIHMPHTWKGPAKHARGSVFAEDFGDCSGPYGVKYLDQRTD